MCKPPFVDLMQSMLDAMEPFMLFAKKVDMADEPYTQEEKK